jgi:hypothetical protein
MCLMHAGVQAAISTTSSSSSSSRVAAVTAVAGRHGSKPMGQLTQVLGCSCLHPQQQHFPQEQQQQQQPQHGQQAKQVHAGPMAASTRHSSFRLCIYRLLTRGAVGLLLLWQLQYRAAMAPAAPNVLQQQCQQQPGAAVGQALPSVRRAPLVLQGALQQQGQHLQGTAK